MTGTALETRKEHAPEAHDAALPETQTPTVIDVEAHPITQERPTHTAVLVDRGLALLSSVIRLALLWVENREEQVERITPSQRTSTAPTSAPTIRRSTPSRGGGRRQRRRHRGGTNA